MELENATPSEEITSELNETNETPNETPEPQDSLETPIENEAPTEGEPTEQPAYEPNMSYKFRQEELEIPELFKAIIKDEETNNMVRKLHEKAAGLDFVAESRDRYKQKFNEYQQEVTPKLQQLEDMGHFLEKGDVSSALHVAGFKKEHIIDEAIRLLESEQNPQSQRNYDPQAAIQQRELERQNQMLSQQMEQIQMNNVAQEFQTTIQEHRDAITEYEKANGTGSFQNLVGIYGSQQEQLGRQLTMADAVNEVMAKFNIQSFRPQQAPQVQQPNNQQTPAPKTFPKMTTQGGGSSSSPVAQNIKTFADLEKLSNGIGA